MGATPNIFCPEISKSFEYLKANSDSFFPFGNSYSLFFCAQFRIPWILCWDFCSHQFSTKPFPSHLAREFKIKWWASFKITQAQTFYSVRDWSKLKSPNQRSPQSPRYHSGPNLCQAQLLDPILLQKTHFIQIQPTWPISKKSRL